MEDLVPGRRNRLVHLGEPRRRHAPPVCLSRYRGHPREQLLLPSSDPFASSTPLSPPLTGRRMSSTSALFTLPPLDGARSALDSHMPHHPPPYYPCDSAPHRPTPIRAYSRDQIPHPLRSSPPSHLDPQVYAAMYDHLVARWTVQAQEVAHGHDDRAVKRARTLEGADSDTEPSETGHQHPARRIKLEGPVENDTEAQPKLRTRQTSLPPLPAHPESNIRGREDEDVKPSPQSLRRSSLSEPPIPPAYEPTGIPRAISPALYEPSDHRLTATAPPSPRPIAALPRQSHRRKSSSDALVNVIKSFEVVLQYRAQGWRILDQTMAMERRRSAGGY